MMDPQDKDMVTVIVSIACFAVAVIVGFLDLHLGATLLGGCVAGLVVGYVAKYFFRKKYEGHKLISHCVPICTVCGLIGGLILAVPTALIIWAVLHKKAVRKSTLIDTSPPFESPDAPL